MGVLSIAKWLLSHREEAMKIFEVAQGWSNDLPLVDRWAIVDAVARIVIPILSDDSFSWASSLGDEDELEVMALGGQVAALGIPWDAVTTILFPVLQIVFDFVLREAE